ncbi:MAG TPA: nuclear transport factor 2 family protein [bacterium]|nr:nuclear transport factor 2 family protein [bacterium]
MSRYVTVLFFATVAAISVSATLMDPVVARGDPVVSVPLLGVAAARTDLGHVAQICDVQATFDRAASTKNLDLMMSIWADGATLSVGDIYRYRGKSQIRGWFATRYGAFTTDHWIALTFSPTIRVNVQGTQAHLYFESYYVDLTTMEVKAEEATTATLSQVNDKWLIKDAVFGGLTVPQAAAPGGGCGTYE